MQYGEGGVEYLSGPIRVTTAFHAPECENEGPVIAPPSWDYCIRCESVQPRGERCKRDPGRGPHEALAWGVGMPHRKESSIHEAVCPRSNPSEQLPSRVVCLCLTRPKSEAAAKPPSNGPGRHPVCVSGDPDVNAASVASVTAGETAANVSEPPIDQGCGECAICVRCAMAQVRHMDALKAQLDALPADWSKDSSLKTWFPFTAQELDALKAQNAALLSALEAVAQERDFVVRCNENTREETSMAAVNWFLFKDRGTTAKAKRAIAQKYCTRKHCSGRNCSKPRRSA